MQEKEIAEVVNQRFSDIKKLTRKVIVHFDKQVVYDLRAEIKKLRAFLDLLQTATDRELKIRGRLKSFNGYIGIIRNIQLQERLMQEQGSGIIRTYFQQLDTQAQGWKKEIIRLTLEHADFDEERDRISNLLPRRLSKASIRSYLKQKANDINRLLAMQPVKETDLHAMRKLLKDILYTWPYIKNEAVKLLPVEMNGFNKLEKLTGLLEKYGDQCAALDLLQPACIEKVQNPQDRKLLQEACRRLEKTRDKFKWQVFQALPALRHKLLQSIDRYQYLN